MVDGPAPTDARPRLIYLMSGYFHRLWWCLMTAHVRGAHYLCLEAGNGLGTGEEAPHILPDAIRAAAVFVWRATAKILGSQNPETCLKKPFLSPAVVTDISSVRLSLESSHTHVPANGPVCKQAENVLLYPHRYFHPWQKQARFLVLSGTTRQWQGGTAPANMATGQAPLGLILLKNK